MSVLKSIGPYLLQDISKPSGSKKGFIATATRLAAVVVVPVLASGCMGSGLLGSLGPSPDRKLTTSSIDQAYKAPSDTDSDEATVRNAVSSADLSKPGPLQIPWANTSTGSAGVVNAITEENNGSYVCRSFTTSRHSYRGISNFSGKACLVGSGEWQMVNFKEVG